MSKRISHRLGSDFNPTNLTHGGAITVVMQRTTGAEKILHVTEASGGGVLNVMAQLCRHQAEDGAEVSIVVTGRFDTPAPPDLAAKFVNSTVMRGGGDSTTRNLLFLFATVRKSLHEQKYDVIHLHSSFAGLAGRLARATVWRTRSKLVYSPHAFGFLRADISMPMRAAIWLAEVILAGFASGTIAVSETEARFARSLGSARRVRTLANCLDLDSLPVANTEEGVVANIGRLVAQKGPERFSLAAEAFGATTKFVWIGGPTARFEEVQMSANVEITGNVPHQQAIRRLSTASLHLFTSKWEGMPLALMESQSLGIPAVAWSCPGVHDVVIDGVTGFVVGSEAQMLDKLTLLLTNNEIRSRLADEAWRRRDRFSSVGYGARSLQIYDELTQTGRARSLHRFWNSRERNM